MLWSWVLPAKFGGHRAFVIKLTPTWPQLTPSWPLTPAMHYALVRGSSHQVWWPQGIANQIDPYLIPVDPYMTFDPSIALCSGQDPCPEHCIMLWTGVLPTKFGGHRALLSKLTPTWPQLTPTWPLTLASDYDLVRVLSTKFGGHRALLIKLTPTWSQLTPTWPLTTGISLCSGQGSFPPNLVAIGHC